MSKFIDFFLLYVNSINPTSHRWTRLVHWCALLQLKLFILATFTDVGDLKHCSVLHPRNHAMIALAVPITKLSPIILHGNCPRPAGAGSARAK